MDEQLFRLSPAGAPRTTVLFVPPLFEEANRTRRTLVLAMRALAAQGFAALLPDLPGPNASLVPLISSEEHTSELQSLMRISYAVFCLTNRTPARITHGDGVAAP